MSRTLTDVQERLLQAGARGSHFRLDIQHPDRGWINLRTYRGHNWCHSWEESQSVDTFVVEHTVQLWRQFGSLSLSEFVTQSRANRSDADGLGTYEPLIRKARPVRLYIAQTPAGVQPSDDDWTLMLDGRIQSPNYSEGEAFVGLRLYGNISGQIQDAFIFEDDEYGDDGGTEHVEDVIQDLLDKWAPGITLRVPQATGVAIDRYAQSQERLDQAIQRLALEADVRVSERWYEPTQSFELVLDLPNRSQTVPDFDFGTRYQAPTRIETPLEDVRTMVRVRFLDEDSEESEVTYPVIGTAEGATSTTLEFAGIGDLLDGMPTPRKVRIWSGTNAGQEAAITSVSDDTISVASWPGGTPDTDSKFAVGVDSDDLEMLDEFGVLFLGIAEDESTNIRDRAAAFRMARSAYLAVAPDEAEFEIPLGYLAWHVQINDLLRFGPNGRWWDAEQDLFVQGYTRGIQATDDGYDPSTTLSMRGRPNTAYVGWFQREAQPPTAPLAGPPRKVQGLSLSTGLEHVGQDTQAFIEAEWTPNRERSLAGYELRWRRRISTSPDVFTAWTLISVGLDAGERIVPVVANTFHEVQVRAFSRRNRYGKWSDVESITSSKDETAPATPSAPSVEPAVRGIIVRATTPNTEADLAGYRVHISTTTGFTPDSGTLAAFVPAKPNETVKGEFVDLVPGTTYFVKVEAVDTSGNVSAASGQDSAVADRVDPGDLDRFTDDGNTGIDGNALVTTDGQNDRIVLGNVSGLPYAGGSLTTPTYGLWGSGTGLFLQGYSKILSAGQISNPTEPNPDGSFGFKLDLGDSYPRNRISVLVSVGEEFVFPTRYEFVSGETSLQDRNFFVPDSVMSGWGMSYYRKDRTFTSEGYPKFQVASLPVIITSGTSGSGIGDSGIFQASGHNFEAEGVQEGHHLRVNGQDDRLVIAVVVDQLTVFPEWETSFSLEPWEVLIAPMSVGIPPDQVMLMVDHITFALKPQGSMIDEVLIGSYVWMNGVDTSSVTSTGGPINAYTFAAPPEGDTLGPVYYAVLLEG